MKHIFWHWGRNICGLKSCECIVSSRLSNYILVIRATIIMLCELKWKNNPRLIQSFLNIATAFIFLLYRKWSYLFRHSFNVRDSSGGMHTISSSSMPSFLILVSVVSLYYIALVVVMMRKMVVAGLLLATCVLLGEILHTTFPSYV